MRLFVGLGNPGPKYARNRHNVGFMAIDAIASSFAFPAARRRFQGEISEGRIGDERIALLKPQTFMNESGRSVGEAMRFFKLSTADTVVFHDELDLAPGKVRVKRGGGAAGHNGLRSIDALVGKDYWRIRMGIGHPGDPERVLGHVLSDFASADADWLNALLDAVGRAAPLLAAGDDAKFMSKVALLTQPPRPERKKPVDATAGPEN